MVNNANDSDVEKRGLALLFHAGFGKRNVKKNYKWMHQH